MKTFEIEYTTSIEDRHKTTMSAADKTQAYMDFVTAHPKNYAITDMREI